MTLSPDHITPDLIHEVWPYLTKEERCELRKLIRTAKLPLWTPHPDNVPQQHAYDSLAHITGYGGGAGESIYGEALEGAREDVFIATKVSLDVEDARASVEESLKLLRTDHVDLVQIHGNSYTSDQADAILVIDGMLEQLEQLKNEGLTRFVGFTSEDNNAAVFRFIDLGRFDVMQISYNLLHQHPAEWTRPFGSLFEAREMGVGVVTMRTLTSGIFQKWVNTVRPNDDFDFTPSLLQFVLSNPLVNVALVGMRTVDEVECNVAIANDMEGRVDHKKLQRKYPE